MQPHKRRWTKTKPDFSYNWDTLAALRVVSLPNRTKTSRNTLRATGADLMPTKANGSKPKRSGSPTRSKSLVDEVKAAVKAAPWITAADQATVALAIRLARELESEIDARRGALLVNVLGSLGLTVAGRGAKPQEPSREENPLDAIRQRATAAAPANTKPRSAK